MSGKTCKAWVRNKLKIAGDGSNEEVRLGNGKIADWLFEEDNNCVIIEDKEASDVSIEHAEKQLKQYCEILKSINKYKHIISIAVKENSTGTHKVKVFIDDELQKDHPSDTLNSLDYYFNLCSPEFDRKTLIQNITELNEWLYQNHINDNIRASLCCTLLITINKGLELHTSDSITNIKIKVKEKLESYVEGDSNKWTKIEYLYKRFCSDIDIKRSTINVEQIVDIYYFIKNKIWVFLKKDNKNQSYDIMSLFFTTFSKKALSNDLGQYFTPDHFSDLMTELLDLNVNSKVIDIACGSGTFLAKCMDKMIAKANNNQEKILNIKQNQIYGIEKDPTVYGLAMANMILHEDGKSNIINDDSFKDTKEIKQLKDKQIDRLILNPPYSNREHAELEFLLLGLNKLQTNGIGVIIIPTSCALGTLHKQLREDLMNSHTLKAVFTAPKQLFYPVGTNTCIMVWEAHKPHSGETYLMDWKNDNFIKKRIGKGDSTMVCEDYDKWVKIKEAWLKDYFGEQKLGIKKILTPDDSWLYESYIDVDYEKELLETDFLKTIRQYIAFKVEKDIKE